MVCGSGLFRIRASGPVVRPKSEKRNQIESDLTNHTSGVIHKGRLPTMATRKAKKAPAKKAPAKKKAAAKKAAPAAKAAPALKDKLTKTQIVASIAESTNLSKKQVGDVMAELETLIERSIKKRAVGEFTLPGLMKITTVKKPAVKARKGINPFTKEEVMFKAKPASVAVKVRPLKKMKEFAQG